MDSLTYGEIEEIRETFCEACKGSHYINETNCYENCEGFKGALTDLRKEEEDYGNTDRKV